MRSTLPQEREQIMKLAFTAISAAFGLAAVGLGVPAFAAGEPAVTVNGPSGEILTTHEGMTLYTFDKDSGNKSACNDKCASNWPPLAADSSATPVGKYTVVTRDDGSRQWAYDGKPLYTWSKDTKKGDMTGDNVNNVWHVAKP